MKHIFTFLMFIMVVGAADAQWKQNAGIEGGSITALSANGTTLFAGTNNGGVYRSMNNGDEWTAINTGLGDYSITSIFQRGELIFAGTQTGLYRSENNGSTWSFIADSLVIGVPISFTSQGEAVIVHSNKGLLRSLDKGNTWTKIQVPGKDNQVACIAVMDDDIYLSLLQAGIYKSKDNGLTWAIADTSYNYVSWLFVHGGTVIGTMAGYGYGKVIKSDDRGASWTEIGKGLPASPLSRVVSDGAILYAIIVNYGLYQSTDNGSSWISIQSPDKKTSILAVNGTSVFAATGTYGTGIYRSNSGGNEWEIANKGMSNVAISKIAFSADTLIATGQGYFSSSDYGQSWTRVDFGGISNIVNILVHKGVIVVQNHDQLRINTERDGLWGYPLNNTRFNKILLKNDAYFGIGYGYSTYDQKYIVRSNDDAKTWKKADTGLPKLNTPVDLVLDGSQLLAAYKTDGIFRSTDDGQTWSPINTKPFKSLSITSLVACPQALFVNTSAGRVFRSIDHGDTWDEVTAPHITTIRALTFYSTSIIAGTSAGVFRSNDTGRTWSPINLGLLNLDILDVAVHNNTLYAGTGGSGLWTLDLTTLAVNEEVASTPQLTLYPNPATSTITIISPSLSTTSGDVEYAIYSVTGEKVVEGGHPEPRLSLPVDALPTGVYSLVARQGMVRTSVVFSVVR
jgi:photosystem II stability/assembly factor-like uncharacterized protein